MDVILLNPVTGIVENVICADSVARARQYYPQYTCVQRPAGSPVSPGWFSGDGGVTFSPAE